MHVHMCTNEVKILYRGSGGYSITFATNEHYGELFNFVMRLSGALNVMLIGEPYDLIFWCFGCNCK